MNKSEQRERWAVKDLTAARDQNGPLFAPKPAGLHCAARMECVGDFGDFSTIRPVNLRNSQHFVRRTRLIVLRNLAERDKRANGREPLSTSGKTKARLYRIQPDDPDVPEFYSGRNVQILDSLILPFVARLSLREEWFSESVYARLVDSFVHTANVLREYENEDNDEQTLMKFWLDTYLGKVFQDKTPPPRPEVVRHSLFSGWCLHFVKRAIARRDISFIYSLQKGSKRAWPALSDKKKVAALRKHMDRLSQSHGFLSSDVESWIERVSDWTFNSLAHHTSSKFIPSASACSQASRQNGGALSLFAKFDLDRHLESKDAKVMGKLPALNQGLNNWRQDQWNFALREAIRGMQPDSEGYFPALDVEVMAIPEPSKFRIITKGCGYLYTALQPLQGEMLRCWKVSKHSTMRDEDLTNRVQIMHDQLPDVPMWCSVDYEAATDLLKRDATMAVLRRIEKLHPLGELAFQSAFAGRAIYPDLKTPDGKFEAVVAGEGQLMGHPLSFPMLCVINLAVYQCALRRWVDAADTEAWAPHNKELRWRKKEAKALAKHVIVNGDDMLFKCHESFYPIFIKTANDAGFKISAGKNYLSPDMCMINSQVFHIVGNKVLRKGYLNQKFVLGASLKGGESKCLATQVAGDLEKMVKLCPWTRCTVPQTMSRWSKDKFGSRFVPNWYVPVCLGGFGLNPDLVGPGQENVKVTRNQCLIAAMFVHNPKLALYKKTGFVLPLKKIQHAIPNVRLEIFDKCSPKDGEVRGDDVSDDWVARLAYAYQVTQAAVDVDQELLLYRMKPEYRLKPMNVETIWKYRNAYPVAYGTPLCPPVNPIRFPGFITADHIWQHENQHLKMWDSISPPPRTQKPKKIKMFKEEWESTYVPLSKADISQRRKEEERDSLHQAYRARLDEELLNELNAVTIHDTVRAVNLQFPEDPLVLKSELKDKVMPSYSRSDPALDSKEEVKWDLPDTLVRDSQRAALRPKVSRRVGASARGGQGAALRPNAPKGATVRGSQGAALRPSAPKQGLGDDDIATYNDLGDGLVVPVLWKDFSFPAWD